jgi:hypothetical protein
MPVNFDAARLTSVALLEQGHSGNIRLFMCTDHKCKVLSRAEKNCPNIQFVDTALIMVEILVEVSNIDHGTIHRTWVGRHLF